MKMSEEESDEHTAVVGVTVDGDLSGDVATNLARKRVRNDLEDVGVDEPGFMWTEVMAQPHEKFGGGNWKVQVSFSAEPGRIVDFDASTRSHVTIVYEDIETHCEGKIEGDE